MPPPLDLVKLEDLRLKQKLSISKISALMGVPASTIQDKLRKSGLEKAKQTLATAPYGWRRDGTILVKDSQEQQVLREINTLTKQGLGIKKIAKILNDRKISTRFNGKWWPNTVSRLRKRLK